MHNIYGQPYVSTKKSGKTLRAHLRLSTYNNRVVYDMAFKYVYSTNSSKIIQEGYFFSCGMGGTGEWENKVSIYIFLFEI